MDLVDEMEHEVDAFVVDAEVALQVADKERARGVDVGDCAARFADACGDVIRGARVVAS